MWYKFRVSIAGKKEVLEIIYPSENYIKFNNFNSDDPEINATNKSAHNAAIEKDYQIIKQLAELPKYEPIVAYFWSKGYKNNNDLEIVKDIVRKLKILDSKKPIIINASKNGIVFNGQKYHQLLQFQEAVDHLYTLISHKKRENFTSEEISPGEIKIYKANSVSDACRLGLGTSWCIAQPGNTNYQSYRDTQQSTFYFVYDGTRESGDPLSRVVVDMTANGISLTDLNNQTGTIAEFGTKPELYMDYLKSKGVDISQFKNNPVTKEEEQEQTKLGEENDNLGWFQRLSYDEKSKYIGRGHRLSNEQFKYLADNNADDLISQYLDTGVSIPPSQTMMIKNKQKYLKTYERKRKIAVDQIIKHYFNFSEAGGTNNSVLDKTIRHVYTNTGPTDWENAPSGGMTDALVDLISYASSHFDYELMTLLIEKGVDATDFYMDIPIYGNYSQLKEICFWLVNHGGSANRALSKIMAPYYDYTNVPIDDIVELVKKGADPQKAANYFDGSTQVSVDVLKWLVEKGAHSSYIFNKIAKNPNNIETLEWLIDHGADPSMLIEEVTEPAAIKYLVEKGADPVEAYDVAQYIAKDPELLNWLQSRIK